MSALDVRLVCVAGPTAEPLVLEQVKTDRLVDHSDDDNLLIECIQAARERAEGITGRALMPQEWQELHPVSPTVIELQRWPVLDLVSVTVDGEAVDHVALIAAGDMDLMTGDCPELSWSGFRSRRVVVRYQSGYETAADVPASIRRWMLLQVGSMYEHRESEIVGSSTSRLRFVDGLLGRWKVRRFY